MSTNTETANSNKNKKAFAIKDMVMIAFCTALMAVCAWISIPIPSVPFTLQLFAVYAALFILGGRNGTISILVYIALGAVGVPVFTGFKGGLASLLGLTGGYIVGFIFTGLIYWLITVLAPKKTIFQIIAAISGLIICYAFGTAWFIVAYSSSTGAIGVGAALMMCVVPYIIPDFAKIALALVISKILKKALKGRL